MKVKLCGQCSYKPGDLGELYDPAAPTKCCADCKDDPIPQSTNIYPREHSRMWVKEAA